MKVQLDTDIVIDLLEERKPYVQVSGTFFNEALKRGHNLSITANSIDNIAYILRKLIPPKQLADGLLNFLKFVDVTPVDSNIIHRALRAKWNDIEDCIQYYSALANEVDLIVTRNVKDYESSKTQVVTPKEALQLINSA